MHGQIKDATRSLSKINHSHALTKGVRVKISFLDNSHACMREYLAKSGVKQCLRVVLFFLRGLETSSRDERVFERRYRQICTCLGTQLSADWGGGGVSEPCLFLGLAASA